MPRPLLERASEGSLRAGAELAPLRPPRGGAFP